MSEPSHPWPTELRLVRAERRLEVDFDDGFTASLPAELLRVESPSAEVQGHGGDQKRIVPGKRQVAIIGVEPVGNYAVRLRFDDGHDTGIFTWRYLRELADDQEQIFQRYLDGLAGKGLLRDA